MRSPPGSPTSALVTAQLACILEVSARKPGNVHPGRSFGDAGYIDFILSAAAIGPAMERAAARPVGETVLDAVRATREVVGRNTNLGIILLLAPLAAMDRKGIEGADRAEIRRRVEAVLGAMTFHDAELVYEAIRLAAPGGLGEAPEGDVRGRPAGTLLEMMALAAGRDLVAREYVTGYAGVLDGGLPVIERARRSGHTLEEAIILCHLELIAAHGDSLIARKLGAEASLEASRRARAVLDAGWPEPGPGRRELELFDDWLRADSNRRNPGACADLTVAALFVAISNGIIDLPIASWSSG